MDLELNTLFQLNLGIDKIQLDISYLYRSYFGYPLFHVDN